MTNKKVPQLHKVRNVGFIADIHTFIHKFKKDHFEHVENMFTEFIAECKRRNIDVVFILGDLFEQKFVVATEALVRINRKIAELAEVCTVIVIPGNHDMAYYQRPDVNLASNYDYFHNVTVIDAPTATTIGGHLFYMLPYSEKPLEHISSEKISECMKHFDITGEKVLCSHFGVRGFELGTLSSDKDDDAVPIQSLAMFDRVYLGHYHGRQVRENVTYVSSPMQLGHGDEQHEHGFVFWDIETKSDEFVPYTKGPRYMTVPYSKDGISSALAAEAGVRLRVKVSTRGDLETMLKLKKALVARHGQHNVVFDDSEARAKDKPKLVAMEQFRASGYKDVSNLLVSYVDRVEALDKLPAHTTKSGLLMKLKELESDN